MPGPITPPISIPRLAIFDDLAAVWRQNRHPLYNAAGKVFGSYDTLDAACQGKWYIDAGAVRPPMSQVYVSDFWGKRVPLSTQCARSAKANATGNVLDRVVYPQIVTPAAAVSAAKATNTAATGSPVLDLDALSGPSPDAYGRLPALAQTQVGTYALYAALAVGGLLLFLPSDRRR